MCPLRSLGALISLMGSSPVTCHPSTTAVIAAHDSHIPRPFGLGDPTADFRMFSGENLAAAMFRFRMHYRVLVSSNSVKYLQTKR